MIRKSNRKTFTKIRKWAEEKGYEVVDNKYFEGIKVKVNEDLAFEIENRESTIYTSIRGKKGNPKGIYFSIRRNNRSGYSINYPSQVAIIERMVNEIVSYNHSHGAMKEVSNKVELEVAVTEETVEAEEKSCEQSAESTTLSHLSEDITYFSYYTKRKNRYFFTAWINEVYSHIILEIQDGDISMEFTGEPNKEVVLKAGQQELILEACKKELCKRKDLFFLELEAKEEKNMKDQTIVEIKKENGEETAIAYVPMNLGKVVVEDVSEDGKTHTVAVGMYTKSTANYFAQALYERAEHIGFDEFKELLDTYFNTRLLDTIGIEQAPIHRNKDGVIVGLREEVLLKDFVERGE